MTLRRIEMPPGPPGGVTIYWESDDPEEQAQLDKSLEVWRATREAWSEIVISEA